MRVGGLDVNMVDSAGADEFGWLKSVFSAGLGARTVLVSESLGDSAVRPLDSNESGGRKGVCEDVTWCACLCNPSMWSGSGDGI